MKSLLKTLILTSLLLPILPAGAQQNFPPPPKRQCVLSGAVDTTVPIFYLSISSKTEIATPDFVSLAQTVDQWQKHGECEIQKKRCHVGVWDERPTFQNEVWYGGTVLATYAVLKDAMFLQNALSAFGFCE